MLLTEYNENEAMELFNNGEQYVDLAVFFDFLSEFVYLAL